MAFTKLILCGATLMIFATATLAQDTTPDPMAGMDHSAMEGMDHTTMNMGDMPQSPSSAYMQAMDVMMADMDGMAMTGDAEIDFLLMMIPHHQSAVDMSIALLPAVQDPELKALAEDVIKAQESEIAMMEAMLVRLGYTHE